MKQTIESASLEYFNKNSKYRPEMEFVIRTAFEAGAEWATMGNKIKNKKNENDTNNRECVEKQPTLLG